MSTRLAIILELQGVAQAPLVRAVGDGHFGMLGSDHSTDNVSRHKLDVLPEPYLVCVSANQGPEQTACARYMREWSYFSVVHARAEHVDDYKAIARLVPLYRRVLLVETLPAHAAAWLAFLSGKPSENFLEARS